MDPHRFASPAKRNFFSDPSYQLFKNAFFLPCYLCFSLIWNLLHTGYLFVLIKERRNVKFSFKCDGTVQIRIRIRNVLALRIIMEAKCWIQNSVFCFDSGVCLKFVDDQAPFWSRYLFYR
jgi:hypothetical protein